MPLRSVQRPRLFEEIVAQIRGRIEDGTFAEGTTLPSEKEMCRIFKASRLIVKEAFSVLRQLGVVKVRMGRGGGYYVSTPKLDDVTAPLELLLLLHQSSVIDMMEARLCVEGQCALLAAIRRDENDLAKLRTAMEEMEASVGADPQRFVEADSNFHLAVAKASKNPVLRRVMQSLRGALRKSIAETIRVPGFARHACVSHRRTLAAIEDQDPQEAMQAIGSSIGRFFVALEHSADEDQAKRLDAAIVLIRILSGQPRSGGPELREASRQRALALQKGEPTRGVGGCAM